VIGVADGGNWRAGIPTLETSIRGVVDCIVTVRALDLAVHSGAYGGPAIDAISALSRILASLHDDDGQVAIEGLIHGPWEGLHLTEEEYREETPLRPSVSLVGQGIDLGAAVVQAGGGRARPGRPRGWSRPRTSSCRSPPPR
jgi:acetylornithine deacetylase/succinyl-diaminopimelate desuccinylase-like protein